ncbi:MAG: T9SS type A sorting domain-containing protein [Bacteroidales bacterium]|nr:T9SS type A sorting domain-containing protein [Bacteroidales bacterium]
MKRTQILLVLLVLSFVSWSQTSWRPGEMEAKVYLHSSEDLLLLKSLKLMDEPAMENGALMAWVYLTPQELVRLQASGLDFTITNPDLNTRSQNFWDQLPLESYHNYNQLVALSDSLSANFPEICKKIVLGTTPQGRQIGILKISDNVEENENEPELMFDGGIHGDEIMGPELVIRYARDLCLGYGNDSVITSLIDNREIWLYYLVNPDGFVNTIRYNSNGVDLNRDVGFMWGGEGYSPYPFSQPETRILRSLWLDHSFLLYTNYHGGSEIISLPWSYRVSHPPDWTHIQQLAAVYSSYSGYANLSYGQGCIVMYQILGSTKDFNYGSQGQVSWSMEISLEKQPPASQIAMYYSYNAPAMTEMINRVGRGVNGVVTDSLTGSPVKAALFVGSFYPVYTDAQVGDYHKYLLQGSYSITVKASGYQTKTISGVTVPSQGDVTTDIQLIRDPGRFAYRTIVTNIPSFPGSGNYSDECYVPGIIGPPDSVNYSLGKSGYIIMDMGDTIYNGDGDDFQVFEGDLTPEGYYCYVSLYMDGPWISMGSAAGTASFDLSDGPASGIRYIKLTDDGDGVTNANDAGFDLDAIEILTPPLIADFYAGNLTPCAGDEVDFFDASIGNPTEWLWHFPGGIPSTSTEKNPSGIIYDTPGDYSVTLTIVNPFTHITLTKNEIIHVGDPLAIQPGHDPAVKVYPNPNSGMFYLEMNLPGKIACKILTGQSNMIHSFVLEGPATGKEIVLPHLAKGIYFLHIQSENQTIVKKLMIQ